MRSESDVIGIYLDLEGEDFASSTPTGQELVPILTGFTLAEIIENEGFDSVSTHIVTTISGSTILYVIGQTGPEFELYAYYNLYDNAEDAIISHSSASEYFVSSNGPLSDYEISQNAYLIENNLNLLSLADVATEVESPLEYTEVYETEWTSWSDVYVVIHYGNYYIGWYWL